MEMRGWILQVQACEVDDEAPPTHFHGHFKAHDIYY